MQVRNRVIGLLAAVLVALSAMHAWAFPDFARATKTACAACHTNPAGGAELSATGKSYQTDKKLQAAAAAKAAEYVGVNKCKMCHLEQYKAWQMTKHASALDTLRLASAAEIADMAGRLKVEVKGNPADNPACVTCHVTGYNLAGGYPAADSAKTAAVTHVTCEGCHGPGSLHIPAPTAEKKKFINGHPSASMCMQCHTPTMSPNFKFDEYKAKGVHVARSSETRAA